MPTTAERVAFLEGKVEEHSRGFGELREMVSQLDLKLDRRLDAVDTRFERVERRIDALDQRLNGCRAELAGRIDALDQKVDRFRSDVSRQFLWIVSVQVAVLLAVVGALVGS